MRLSMFSRGALLVCCLGCLASAQVFHEVYSFRGVAGSPAEAALAQGRDGDLYGDYYGSQAICAGGVFRVSTLGWWTDLYNEVGGSTTNCGRPVGGLTLGTDGNFYGAAYLGGTYGYGYLYKLTPSGALTVLYNFMNFGDGAGPASPPIEGLDGNLYGTTAGVFPFPNSVGSVVYKFSLSGVMTTLYHFGTNLYTAAPVIQAKNGNLYATSPFGGAYSCGTIVELATSGQTLFNYSFPCGAGGAYPFGPLFQASDGNLYGTTQDACGACGYYGTIYRLSPDGTVTTIHSFTPDGARYPTAGLTEGTDGYLYGDASSALFRVSKSGDFQLLYTLTTQDGFNISSGLTQHTNGLFYGTTLYGGSFGYGSVFGLDMGLGPFIKLVRGIGRIGDTVEILGQGLSSAVSILFNGSPATALTVVRDTYITAVVPKGAATGPVVVTTSSGTLTSNVDFIVLR